MRHIRDIEGYRERGTAKRVRGAQKLQIELQMFSWLSLWGCLVILRVVQRFRDVLDVYKQIYCSLPVSLWASAWPNVLVSTQSAAMDAQGHTHTQLERDRQSVRQRERLTGVDVVVDTDDVNADCDGLRVDSPVELSRVEATRVIRLSLRCDFSN